MRKNKKKMLITGVSGLLGNNFAYYFKNKYDILGLYCSHPIKIEGLETKKVDILSENYLKKVVRNFSPKIIIHCASLTDVDFCETHQEVTKRVHILGTRFVVDSIAHTNTKLVYISTDSVYNGIRGNFSEDSPISPQNYYGLTKYEGELEVLKRSNSLVLRTNIFGWNIQNKHSIAEWILSQLLNNKPIQGFKDAYFSSIYTFELAKILDLAIDRDLVGVYNCASRTSFSKYEFALKIAQYFNLDISLIEPISIDDFGFKAKRGKNLSLNVSKISRDLNYNLPKLHESIEKFYQDFKAGIPAKIKQQGKSKNIVPPLISIPYGKQSIDQDDINSVVEVLRSDRITQGPRIDEFEYNICKYTGAKYAVAVSSGTAALHCACLALEIKSGDEVITSPNTFVASANCVVYCDAKPVFADIDQRTYNIDPVEIKKRITLQTKAVIPVHFAGQSCDMQHIQKIIKERHRRYGHKIYIIEDASHALGSSYKGYRVGSCIYADMTIMSFHPVKHITTGEGGVILTNDSALFRKLRSFRSHGIINAPQEFINTDEAYSSLGLINPWYYEQHYLGYNYRLTDIQCALGSSQLGKLVFFMKRRRGIVARYNKAFAKYDFVQTPYEASGCVTNWHLYVLRIDFTKLKIERGDFMRELKGKGIQTQVHYFPVHLQPYYRDRFGYKKGDYPKAEAYYRNTISIPLYPLLTDKDIKMIVTSISDIFKSNFK